MKGSKERILQSKDQLSSLGKIDTRAHFGGYSLSVEKVVFAVVSNGELYLRSCEQMKEYIVEHCPPKLVSCKRGYPTVLNYYKVDDELWQSPQQLLFLSESALEKARLQLSEERNNQRLKDLPNINFRLEVLLHQAGICSVSELIETGAKSGWLKLKTYNKNISVNVLYALQGAISGHHKSALPKNIKEELQAWFNHTIALEASQENKKN